MHFGLTTTPFSLLLLAATSTVRAWDHGTEAQNFACPPEDIINTRCLGKGDCLYQNLQGCDSYIQCDPIDVTKGTAKPIIMHCPRGLEWNDVKKQCDDHEHTTCYEHWNHWLPEL
ncbi:Avr4 [Lecanosticta acicola]|uniref:Avr4 n=1 Tax=Lecanosticta acicola TaxID=111012 RepID=A0AAI8YVI1_9PEZI|nr:Avr4 [Lecanosticta acicola]